VSTEYIFGELGTLHKKSTALNGCMTHVVAFKFELLTTSGLRVIDRGKQLIE